MSFTTLDPQLSAGLGVRLLGGSWGLDGEKDSEVSSFFITVAAQLPRVCFSAVSFGNPPQSHRQLQLEKSVSGMWGREFISASSVQCTFSFLMRVNSARVC